MARSRSPSQEMLPGMSTHQPANSRNAASPSSTAPRPPRASRDFWSKDCFRRVTLRRVLRERDGAAQARSAAGGEGGDAEAGDQASAALGEDDAPVDDGKKVALGHVGGGSGCGVSVEDVEGFGLEIAGVEGLLVAGADFGERGLIDAAEIDGVDAHIVRHGVVAQRTPVVARI